MFISEVELGKFLGSVDIIPQAYRAISESNLTYELHTSSSGIDILAFNCSDYTTRFLTGEFDLVSSGNLGIPDFISTKVNSSFSINKAAVELFQNLSDDLKELENKHIVKSLIITGSGLGGYLAILSTLRLHNAIDVEQSKEYPKDTKRPICIRPICITFGSPLVGDLSLQRAIEERPQWELSFLNVVAKNDPVASFFSSDTPYKPFGTFLFCTETGDHTAFEDQDSILLVLDAMKSSNAGNLQVYNYTNVLGSMRRQALNRGVSEPGEFDSNLLRAGIALQLREAGVLGDISNDQIGKMEKKQTGMIKNKKKGYEPTKKLNDMKMSQTYMEWYMMSAKKRKEGYYDSYKNATATDERGSQQEILKRQRFLNQYWKKFVEEKDRMPQKDGSNLRTRWLLGGTNYRRIVEPLDIAYHYKEGKVNYMRCRPHHYKLLEKWLYEDKKDSRSSEVTRTTAASLTEDSCFWAHVEEALISLRDLENGGSSDIKGELAQFEGYVMGTIKNYSLSPDVFLDGSSLMKWWDKYKRYKGSGYASELAHYMDDKSYESYH